MRLRLTCLLLLCLLLCSGSLRSQRAGAAASERPNVLFIAVDDLRPELGCYGVASVESPNIDGLAATGVLFQHAYCQMAVCNPSRVSLLTGLRPDSAKVWDLVTRFRHTVPDVVTLPQHFKSHGYHAVSYGKIFHNPWPDDVSWSEPHRWPKNGRLWSPAARQQLAKFRAKMRAEGKSDTAIKRMRAVATEIVDMPEQEHIDVAIADQGLRAMRRIAKNDDPFFLAVGFVRPHLPFVVPRRYWDLYDRRQIPLAANPFIPRGAPPFALNTMYELRDYMDFAGTADPRAGSLSESQQRQLKHGYYAAVSMVDAQVGRLLAEIEELNLADRTIVVLWGDHGWKLGEHNSWCKQTNYEIDTRVPLIIRQPNASGNGEVCRALVELVDLYPTLCALARIEPPSHVQGKSLAPLLDDPAGSIKDAAISQFRRRDGKTNLMGYSMRTQRHRYIEWINRKSNQAVARELYDHQSNSAENTNLAEEPGNRALIQRLSKQLWSAIPPPPPLAEVAKPIRPKDRPNILVIMGDDWSWPHASILADPVVKTPTFDRIAKAGVLFQYAFVSSPSCTPSRFAVASGQHHWRLGGGDSLGGSLPADLPVYPDLLAAAGYRTGFCRKGAAPSSHVHRGNDPFGPRFNDFGHFIAQRDPGEPFCFWYGAGEPHRPYDWQASLSSDLALEQINVPVCLPDNQTVRTDLGDYYLRVQKLDRLAGRIIEQLEDSGELENTIVIMTGDNGMPFPRCKATLYDTGTRVPLAIRWGKQVPVNRRVSDFVSLTDLAPTILQAAGVPVPPAMTGKSLIPLLTSEQAGKIDPRRDHVLFGRERHVYPWPARGIRTRDYLYIRNFSPDAWTTGTGKGETPRYDFSKSPWPTEPPAFSFNCDPSPTKQWMIQHAAAIAKLHKLSFGLPAEEELYDLRTDPNQMNNIADDADHRDIRQRLSAQLEAELRASNDPRLAAAPTPD